MQGFLTQPRLLSLEKYIFTYRIASNRGIKEHRDVRETINVPIISSLAGSNARIPYKVGIIFFVYFYAVLFD